MEDNKKIFCAPYNGDFPGVKRLVEDYGDHIYEFYGCDGRFNSAKSPFDAKENLDVRIDSFGKTVEFLNKNNVKFNYTLNGVHIKEYLNEDNTKNLLKNLKDVGVDSITLSAPYLIPWVKEAGFKIVHSVLQDVYSEFKIKYLLEYGGGDRFIIHQNFNRQIDTLKYLKSILPSKSSLEMIVNLECRLFCPNDVMHYTAPGHEVWNFISTFCRKENRSIQDWLKRVWIRHKDIKRYQNIGISYFKIVERTMPSEAIYSRVKYFIDGTTISPSGKHLYPSYFRDFSTGTVFTEEDLDEYFDFVFSEPGCTGRCTECKFCDIYEDKLNKKYNLSEAFMKLHA
jgi:collagenase-like PrtC family protease